MKAKKLYLIILIFAVFAYLWLAYQLFFTREQVGGFTLCFFKNISGFPCPACGSTRTILFILKGEIISALNYNPIGFLSLLFMIIIPLWVLIDKMLGLESFYKLYIRLEYELKKPQYFIPLICLVIMNWILVISRNL